VPEQLEPFRGIDVFCPTCVAMYVAPWLPAICPSCRVGKARTFVRMATEEDLRAVIRMERQRLETRMNERARELAR
jgi:hypothetical protein